MRNSLVRYVFSAGMLLAPQLASAQQPAGLVACMDPVTGKLISPKSMGECRKKTGTDKGLPAAPPAGAGGVGGMDVKSSLPRPQQLGTKDGVGIRLGDRFLLNQRPGSELSTKQLNKLQMKPAPNAGQPGPQSFRRGDSEQGTGPLPKEATGIWIAQGKTFQSGSKGVVAYIDPKTGKLTTKPPVQTGSEVQDAELRAFFELLAKDQALSRVQEGLKQVPLRDGGFVIDLKGRFQSPLLAITKPDGSVSISHGDE